MNVAIIPARGGSKRVPRKNIKHFCGKPIIAWSIEAAIESGCFDHVLVSTDDEEIADIAGQYGALAPFIRPAELSDDYTSTIPVIAHAIEWVENNIDDPDLVCCIYATAPFLQADELRKGLELLKESEASYVFPVTSFPFPIQRAVRLTSDNHVEMFYPEHFNTRSQDLDEAYHDAGQFYWAHKTSWLSGESIFSPNSVSLILPRYRVQDIDTEEDWVRAESMFRLLSFED